MLTFKRFFFSFKGNLKVFFKILIEDCSRICLQGEECTLLQFLLLASLSSSLSHRPSFFVSRFLSGSFSVSFSSSSLSLCLPFHSLHVSDVIRPLVFLTHLTQCDDLSAHPCWLQVTSFCSVLRLSSAPWCPCTTSLSVHLSVGI